MSACSAISVYVEWLGRPKDKTRCIYIFTLELSFSKAGNRVLIRSDPIRSDYKTTLSDPIRSEMILPDPKSEKIRSDRIRIGFGSDLHISNHSRRHCVRRTKSHGTRFRFVPYVFCFSHAMTSSVIYYITDTQKIKIHLLSTI